MIKELDKIEYSDIKYSVNIKVDKYLEVIPNESGFKLEWKDCKEHINKLEDEILSSWLDDPVIYGYFIDDKLVGFDRYAYTNNSHEHNIRIEMGMIL